MRNSKIPNRTEWFFRVLNRRFMFVFASLFLVTACNTTFAVTPKPSTTSNAPSLETASKISVKGTETFDRTINPVTFSCGIIDFNIQFSAAAEEIITERLVEKLGKNGVSKFRNITVIVGNTMIRTMNFVEATFDPRFDVEARISLIAETESFSGVKAVYSTTNQSIHTGGIVEETITCGLGKEQLEKSLPILLERAVDALAEKMI